MELDKGTTVDVLEHFEDRLQSGFHKQIEYIAKHDGSRLALCCDNTRVTYAELNSRANQIAHAIESLGQYEYIATVMSDSLNIIHTMLAVFKLTVRWIPINSKLPHDTMDAYIDQFENVLTITDHDIDLPTKRHVYNLNTLDLIENPPEISYDAPPNYIMTMTSTSGSTGVPKSVPKPYAGILKIIIRPRIRNLMILGDFSFGNNNIPLIAILAQGGTVHTLNLQSQSFQDIHQYLKDQKIEEIKCVPSIFRVLFANVKPGDFPHLKKIRMGSEPFLKSDVDLFHKNFASDTTIYNAYGSAEAGYLGQFKVDHQTVITTRTVPVGIPPKYLDVYVVNENGERVVGEEGEIYVSGANITPYWNNPEVNAEKFFPDSNHEGWIVFRSGDLGMFLEDGNLVHLGRKDHRVKIRGQQVDMTIVENELASYGSVQHVIVNPYTVKSEYRLAAYIVLKGNQKPKNAEWRTYLANKLPYYMIPSTFIILDELPKLPNGKVNRKALPDPTTIQIERDTPVISPNTETEKELLAIWKEILDIPMEISTDDSFFHLGGSSLQATALISDVNELKNIEIK